jgi:acetyltransferase-like isoleucine patch superfamily enzyme
MAFTEFAARIDMAKWGAPTPGAARAAVVVTPWSGEPVPWFALTMACLLRREGLSVTLVLNDICGPSDSTTLPITFAFENRVIEACLPRFRSFEIMHLTQLAPALLADDAFDFVLVPEGLHDGGEMLAAAARAAGVRVSTFDVRSGHLLVGLDGPASRLTDVPRAFAEAAKLLGVRRDVAQQIARERLRARMHGDQAGPVAEVVILPGVQHAAGPTGGHRCFRDDDEWLVETVAFLLDRTQARVAVCQEPGQNMAGGAAEVQRQLTQRWENHPRFRIVGAAEPGGTLSLIAGCRLVLPGWSTIGVEAAMLGKPLVMDSGAYYAGLPFVDAVTDKASYFARIVAHMQQPSSPAPEKIAAAELCFFFAAVCSEVETAFVPSKEAFAGWSKMSFDALAADDGVKSIVRALAYDIPVAAVQGRKRLDRHQAAPAPAAPLTLVVAPAPAPPAPVAVAAVAAAAAAPSPPAASSLAALSVTAVDRSISAIGLPFPCFDGVTMGTGVQIIGMNNVEIGPGSCVGDFSWLNVCVRDDKLRLRIGRSVLIGRQSMVSTGGYLEIGDYCLFGPRVTVVDADHGFSDITRPYAEQTPTLDRSIIVEENCWIAVGAVVAGHLTVGRGSVVGANAVVTQDVPPFSVVVGHPARIVKMYDPVTRRWESAKTEAEQQRIQENRARVPLPDRDQYRALLRDNAQSSGVIPIVAGRGECL